MIIGLSGYIGSGKDTVAKMIIWLTNSKERKLWDNNLEDFLYINPQDFYINPQDFNWEIKKFAGKLKQMASLLTGIPVEDFEKQSVKDSLLGSGWSWWYYRRKDRDGNPEESMPFGWTDQEAYFRRFQHIMVGEMYQKPMTVRHLLQYLGTNAVRDNLHPNAWVNALFADYKKDRGLDGAHIGGRRPDTVQYPNWIISDTRFPNEAQAIKDKSGIVIRINRSKEFWKDEEWLTGKKVYHEPIHLHPSETSLNDWEFDYEIMNIGTLKELLQEVKKMLINFKLI